MISPPATGSSAGRPHVLYVAWGFPPSRSAGVYRALATANRFAERGWDVTVVTVQEAAFARYIGTDPSLTASIDPRIEVLRTPFSWPMLEPDVARWPRARVLAPRTWARLRNAADRVPFPEVGYGPWRGPLERAAEDVHRRRPVDLVVATANPHVSFAAAARLHRRHGIPYVMDYRDAWQLDVFSGDRLVGPRSRTARTEARLVKDAAEVWYVNDEIRDWHRAVHPAASDRMHTVANGFDPAFSPAPRDPVEPTSGGVTFGYIGTVTPKVPMAEFVAGWRVAVARGHLPAGSKAHIHGYLGYYGQPRADVSRLLADAEDVGVSYRGPVGKDSVRKTYGDMDALLLILGAGRYVTSGKVFEYLAAGLPIVSVHDPANAAGRVLAEYPLWFPAASLAPDDVADALGRAAQAVATPDPAAYAQAREVGSGFSRQAQLDPRLDELESLVRGGAR